MSPKAYQIKSDTFSKDPNVFSFQVNTFVTTLFDQDIPNPGDLIINMRSPQIKGIRQKEAPNKKIHDNFFINIDLKQPNVVENFVTRLRSVKGNGYEKALSKKDHLDLFQNNLCVVLPGIYSAYREYDLEAIGTTYHYLINERIKKYKKLRHGEDKISLMQIEEINNVCGNYQALLDKQFKAKLTAAEKMKSIIDRGKDYKQDPGIYFSDFASIKVFNFSRNQTKYINLHTQHFIVSRGVR